jgi:hypothetical protein
MIQIFRRAGFSHFWGKLVIVLGLMLLNAGCTRKTETPAPPRSEPSNIQVVVKDAGPAVVTTSVAEFVVQPSGYIQAFC